MPDNVPAGHVVIRTTGFEELLQKINSAGVERCTILGVSFKRSLAEFDRSWDDWGDSPYLDDDDDDDE